MFPDSDDTEFKPFPPLGGAGDTPDQGSSLGAPPPDAPVGEIPLPAPDELMPGKWLDDPDRLTLDDFSPGERRQFHFLGRFEEMARDHEKRIDRPATSDELNGFADIAKASAIRAEPFTDDEQALFKARGQSAGGGIARLSDEKPAGDAPASAPAPAAPSIPAPAPAGEAKPAESTPALASDTPPGAPPASPSTPAAPGSDTLAGGTGSDTVTLGPSPKPEAEGAPQPKAEGEPKKEEGGFLGWLKSLFGGSQPPAQEPGKPAESVQGGEKKPAEDGKAPDMSITPEERQMAEKGDAEGFWKSRLAKGDPAARVALGTLKEEGGVIDHLFGAGQANGRLEAFSRVYTGKSADLDEIHNGLMKAHVEAVEENAATGGNGQLTPKEIANYHHRYFNRIGLPTTVFGGTPFTGAQWEADLTAPLWYDKR
jgi:hypothetical protein